MAAMSCAEGPFGPGLRRCPQEEKSRRYLRSTSALWNLNSMEDLRIADSFGMRRGLTNCAVSPSTKRSSVVRFGARCRERLLINSWCLSSSDSAATARTPPGRRSFARVTSRWIAKRSRSRMGRTVPHPLSCARLHGTSEFRHTANSPPTGRVIGAGRSGTSSFATASASCPGEMPYFCLISAMSHAGFASSIRERVHQRPR